MNITLKELYKITGISTNTLRSWLSGWRFSKYRLSKDYKYSNEFIQSLIEFLEIKGKYKAINNLQNYINGDSLFKNETN